MVINLWSSGQRPVQVFGRFSAALSLVVLLGACDEKESIDSGEPGVGFLEESSRGDDGGPTPDSAGQTGIIVGPSDEMLREDESKNFDGVRYVVADSPEEANAIFDRY